MGSYYHGADLQRICNSPLPRRPRWRSSNSFHNGKSVVGGGDHWKFNTVDNHHNAHNFPAPPPNGATSNGGLANGGIEKGKTNFTCSFVSRLFRRSSKRSQKAELLKSAIEDGPGRGRGSSGLVLSAQAPTELHKISDFPVPEKQRLNLQPQQEDPTYSDPIEENQIIRLRTSLLQERLDVLETLTKNCQNWQKEEKQEAEAWMDKLTSQVMRSLTLQQLMKSEVEKLQERVLDLESHNRAMATMIVPTLMKLQETIGKSLGRGSEIPGSTQIKIKGRGMDESWSSTVSPTSTVHGGPGSLKEKKIDCRIPRINQRLSRSKHQQQEKDLPDRGGGGDSSSSPDLTPPFSRIPTNGNPPSSLPQRFSSPPSSKAIPKSKSSLTASMHSKNSCTSASSQNKSSTFSGIPRMSSPRPTVQQSRGGEVALASSPSGGGSRNGASNHKNDSQKAPCADLHSNSSGGGAHGGGSRLPILRKTVLPSQSPKSTKTNPSKVTSVIHHQNAATFVGSSGSSKNPIPGQEGCSLAGTAAVVTVPKPLGKDEGYSTMSSEALAEQEGPPKTNSSNDKDISTAAIPKSNTFSTFHHHNFPPPSVKDDRGGGPLPKQLIMMGRERNWTSLPKSASPVVGGPLTLSPGTVVRIVRGISGAVSYEVDGGGVSNVVDEHGGERLTLDESSTATILWEDSDDSDILFLPLELSTVSPGSSSPTLVPPSWPSSATPRLPSSTSYSSTVTNGSQEGRSHRRGPPWAAPPEVADEVQVEEKALIEKWMRLDDGRNQVHWEDEWAWDWDGVERVQVQRTPMSRKFNPDLRLPEFWNCPELEVTSPGKIDSSTWTKSKKSRRNNGNEQSGTPGTETASQSISHGGRTSEAVSPTEALSPTEPDVTTVDHVTRPEESPPPVIDFTPAYYHLVKYGSSTSVNDNQATICTEPFKTKRQNVSSFSSSDEESGCLGKMDDKISQTDFGSSLENLSVSSELFTECRNCLELIKRLVGGIDEACGVTESRDMGLTTDSLMTTLDRERDNLREETLVTDIGAPTTWIPVPKGLPTTEVDRIFEILSSSESEDVLSGQSGNSKGK